MNMSSNKASNFVVATARRTGASDEYGSSIIERKAYSFSKDTTLSEIFDTVWENSIWGRYPESITILPDENSIPEEQESGAETTSSTGPFGE